MSSRRAVAVRLTPYQDRVLERARLVGVPAGAEPPSRSRVLLMALMAWAKANGVDTKPAGTGDDDRELAPELVRRASR